MASWIVPFAGAAAVAFAALMLLQRSLYAAAVCFLAVILQVAVLLYGSGARLLAFLLVLIYAGAVAVLIVVVIHAAGPGGGARDPGEGAWSRLNLPWPMAAAGFLLPLAETIILLARVGTQAPLAPVAAGDLVLGPALFGPYALAAEAVALLMLFASLAVLHAEDRR